jgi:hypothetical protein
LSKVFKKPAEPTDKEIKRAIDKDEVFRDMLKAHTSRVSEYLRENQDQLKKLLRRAQAKRWSYSAYEAHARCPRALGLSYVVAVKQAPNQAMMRGIEMHKKAEYFLKGEIDGMPQILKPMKRELKALRKLKPVVEQFWNADERFRPAKDYQGWCILKMDAHLPPTKRDNVAWMADHKSGREYDKHVEQAELSSVFMLGRYPKIEAAEFEFWYYDTGDPPVRFTFPREHLIELREKWCERGVEVMAERKFIPTPSTEGCKFCPHRSDKGGVCSSWKKAK